MSEKFRIEIVSSSIRIGRKSHGVAKFFQNLINSDTRAQASIIDLSVYNFPLFDERLKYLQEPSSKLLDYASRISAADGILIVTPEYNGGYPAALKNAIDVLYEEWNHKPVAISTISDGAFGGTQVITSLQFTLWKMKAFTVPAMFPVPNVSKFCDENGTPQDAVAATKRASAFLDVLYDVIHMTKKWIAN